MALAEAGEHPVAHLLRVLRDETQSPDLRLRAAAAVMPFVVPKPAPASVRVTFELPEDLDKPVALQEVHASLLRSVACGDVGLEEAKTVSALLDAHRRTIETVSLEERLAAIEAHVKEQRT
jgi:hypothetical protein